MTVIVKIDRNGNFTNEIVDEKEIYNKSLFNKEICVFILNDENQVLLQKRSSNKKIYPNMWALCTGHIEKMESPVYAAKREMKEELGINIDLKNIIPFAIFDESNIHKIYFFYTRCNLKINEFIIQKEELSEVMWFDIDKVIDMIKDHSEQIVYKENRIDLFKKLKDIYFDKNN